MDRVVFYSIYDWSSSSNLQKAEIIINNYDDTKSYALNDLLEFYNIYKYFDNKVFLTCWDENYKNSLLKKVKLMIKKVYKYFNTINYLNINLLYTQADFNYKISFLELISKSLDFINIPNEYFASFLTNPQIRIIDILHLKKIVNKYDKIICEYLINNYEESVPLIVGKYYIDDEYNSSIIIPNSLSLKDKESMINKYLDLENPNLNYVRIIAKIQSNKDSIVISNKIKLKALTKKNELDEKILSNSPSVIEFGTMVCIDKNQEDAVIVKKVKTEREYYYSGKWIKNNLDAPTILNNFIYLFNYVDRFFRIDLVNKKAFSGIFERTINYKIVRSYSPNSEFAYRESLSNMQITAYYDFLRKNNVRLEDTIEWFFRKYLNDEFNVKNFIISMPSSNSNYFEKCKSVLPEFDLILKEFTYFCDDGEINHDLINISSNQTFYKDVPSLVEKKYVYAVTNNDTILIQHYFFSDQCMLLYNPVTKKSYKCFFDLLKQCRIKYVDYHLLEQKSIDWLVDKDLIYIDADGFVNIKNEIMINIYADLYYNEVINYWHYDISLRNQVDNLILNGVLYYENTLFSKPEQDYFNYYLNMAEFIDGYDIRNSNLHGTQEGDKNSKIHFSKYMIILKLLILIIIKINDDFCISSKVNRK